MRYRIKDYIVTRPPHPKSTKIMFVLELSAKILDKLETEEGETTLTEESARYVTESIRLIADETQGGYVLMSTGQKGVVDYILKTEDGIIIYFDKSTLIAAADGDEDDIAAINAMQNTDQFTIEMDWGDEPSGLSGGDAAEQVKDFFGIVKDGDTVKVVTEDGGEEVVEPVGLMDEDDVYDYLEDIAVLMGGITAEQAASITAATRAIIHGGSGSGEGGEGGSGSGSGE